MSSLTPEMLASIAQTVIGAPSAAGASHASPRLDGGPRGLFDARPTPAPALSPPAAAPAPQPVANMSQMPPPMLTPSPITTQTVQPLPTTGVADAAGVRSRMTDALTEGTATNAANLGAVTQQTRRLDAKGNRVAQEEKVAAEQIAESETHHDTLLHEAYGKVMQQADTIDQREQEIIQESQRQAQVQMGRINTAAEGVANTQFQSFFARQDTFGRILGIIAAAAGGAANGLAGTPGAPTPLDRVIDRDMQEQMSQFQQKQQDVQNQRGILNDMRSQTSDLMSGQLAMRKAIDGKLKLMVDDIGTRLGTPAATLSQMKAQIDAHALERDTRTSTALMGNISGILGRDVGLSQSKAELELRLGQLDAQAQKAQAPKAMNRQQANKLADTNNAVQRLDKAIEEQARGDSPSPSEQRDFAEVTATARSNSGTGPKMADREVAGGIVSGSLPHPKVGGLSLPLNEWKTALPWWLGGGYDVKKLREIRAELIEKQRIRDMGVAGGADDRPQE